MLDKIKSPLGSSALWQLTHWFSIQLLSHWSLVSANATLPCKIDIPTHIAQERTNQLSLDCCCIVELSSPEMSSQSRVQVTALNADSTALLREIVVANLDEFGF